MSARRRFGLALLAAAQLHCSVVLTSGPPRPGHEDYDPSGRYEDGVPCTTSRLWPLVDLGMLISVIAVTANYPPEATDDRLDGIATAAALVASLWIGYSRTSACRELEQAATP